MSWAIPSRGHSMWVLVKKPENSMTSIEVPKICRDLSSGEVREIQTKLLRWSPDKLLRWNPDESKLSCTKQILFRNDF